MIDTRVKKTRRNEYNKYLVRCKVRCKGHVVEDATWLSASLELSLANQWHN